MNEDNKQIKVWYLPIAVMLIFATTWFLWSLVPVSLELVKTIENANIKNFFVKYNQHFGWAAGALSMIVIYVLLIITKLFKSVQKPYLQLGVIIVCVLPWLILALQLIYREERYTDLARALIIYSAWPMFTASLVVIIASLGFFKREYLAQKIKVWRGKNLVLALFFLVAPFVLTACVGDLILPACSSLEDSDICYQTAAIQESRPELCEKIIGKNFLGASSNPPRDKCYLKIAETAGDLSACDQIKGGLMSYSREECLIKTARTFTNPLACEKLEGIESIKCRMELMIKVTPEKLLEIDKQIEEWKNKMGSAEQLKKLEERREAMMDVMSAERRNEYESLKKGDF